MLREVLTGILILTAAAPACSWRKPSSALPPPFPRQEIVAQIKDFQKTLGFQDTQNFSRYSGDATAFYRCYYTGKLELAASYDELQLTEGDATGCSVDEQKYDVLFYPVEAAASGRTPVTPALAEASLERFLVVVPHEDFHNQKEAEDSSPEIAEAAATLTGFLTAAAFAEEIYGPALPTSRDLRWEASLFLQKAGIVNNYYDKLNSLYASFRSGEISRQEALAQKDELLAQLQRECSGITPEPVSFNKCPAAMNNAGLAFDRTYTRYYPLLFDLFVSHGQDARATIAALQRLLATHPQTESDLRSALANASAAGASNDAASLLCQRGDC